MCPKVPAEETGDSPDMKMDTTKVQLEPPREAQDCTISSPHDRSNTPPVPSLSRASTTGEQSTGNTVRLSVANVVEDDEATLVDHTSSNESHFEHASDASTIKPDADEAVAEQWFLRVLPHVKGQCGFTKFRSQSRQQSKCQVNSVHKILAIGLGDCATTNLLTVFKRGDWPTQHRPTDFRDYVMDCSVDSKRLKLLLIDTTGEEPYPALRKLKYTASGVILLCFRADCSLGKAFGGSKVALLRDIYEICPSVPFILVGIHDPEVELTQSNGQEYERHYRERFARLIGASTYLWCNPRTGQGVDDVFEAASRAILLRYQQPQPSWIRSVLSNMLCGLGRLERSTELRENGPVRNFSCTRHAIVGDPLQAPETKNGV